MVKEQLVPGNEDESKPIQLMSEEFKTTLENEIKDVGVEFEVGEEFEGAVGRTMFDTPTSKDNTVTVLLPPDQIGNVPAQSLVRIKCRPAEKGGDGRQYLGAVVQGPFAEPDGLRADAPIVVTTTVRGTMFMPRYHGRIQVQILAEEIDETLMPPRFRPLPNSPVFALSEDEIRLMLGLDGDIELGMAVGFLDMPVNIPSRRKSVLPRHLGVLGTTGGGKSTTVSGLIHQLHSAGIATIIIDTEGEYTEIDQPTEDKRMKHLLSRSDRKPSGVKNLNVFHLVGRETTAISPTPIFPFRLEFSNLSPYAASEILELNDAQQDRFFKAYEVTKSVLRDLGIFPRKRNKDDERLALEIDEFEVGYPGVTLSRLIDIASYYHDKLGGGEPDPFNREFQTLEAKKAIEARIAQRESSHPLSWRALLGKLWRIHHIKVFDNPAATALDYSELLTPGRTNIIDLSDTQSPILNNLVIADILRGIREQQETLYKQAEQEKLQPTPAVIIIEEAHEFLSRTRIAKMPNLFEQVARIARRGRKRWLGLVFVTQLPQHLPDEVLALINNYIIHKITDANVITRLKRSIGGIDEGLWEKLPNLAPGQAVVTATSMARPLLVTINPTPCKLRMTE
jgi:DNA helicase HerA-like ATPase